MTRPDEQLLIKVCSRVYWMSFPKQDRLPKLQKLIQKQFNNSYYIWNLSEHSYETEHFNNLVASHQYSGYPCPPLYEIFLICKCILNWLAKDLDNIAIVHCQYTKGRSVLVLSLLLAMIRDQQPDQCFLKVCEILHVDESLFFPSHHLYLRYIGNAYNSFPLNSTKVRLVSVILNKVPKMRPINDMPYKDFTPYLQIVQDGQITYDSLDRNKLIAYKPNEQGCLFHIGGIDLIQDTVIRCKNYYSEALRYPVFRTMFHTSFLFENVLRLYGRDLDVSATIEVSSDFFVDFIFEFGDEKSQQNFNYQNEEQKDWSEITLSEKDQPSNQLENEANIVITKLIEQCKMAAISYNEQERKKLDQEEHQQSELLEQKEEQQSNVKNIQIEGNQQQEIKPHVEFEKDLEKTVELNGELLISIQKNDELDQSSPWEQVEDTNVAQIYKSQNQNQIQEPNKKMSLELDDYEFNVIKH